MFLKRKVRLCARRDQQIEGESFNASDLHAPTLKAPEARLLAAIAAEHCCPLLKTDTRQAFLYEDRGGLCIRPLIGGPNQYRKVMFSYFSKACMARNRPPEDSTLASRIGWSRTDTLQ